MRDSYADHMLSPLKKLRLRKTIIYKSTHETKIEIEVWVNSNPHNPERVFRCIFNKRRHLCSGLHAAEHWFAQQGLILNHFKPSVISFHGLEDNFEDLLAQDFKDAVEAGIEPPSVQGP